MHKINTMKVKSRIWIEKDDTPFLGYGRIQLLKEVDKTHSMSEAARSLNMSYKKAWRLLNEINSSAKEPVLDKQIGGKHGGGTHITPYGKGLIERFEKLNEACIGFLETEFKNWE
jgi:molybdate transport system regulatory protein